MDWFNLNVDDTADDNDDGDRQYNRYVSVSTTFISGETKQNQNQHGVKDKYTYKKCISYMSQYDPFWTPFGPHTKNIISKIILHKDISSNFNPKLVIPLDNDI